jgi:hypothetical protein
VGASESAIEGHEQPEVRYGEADDPGRNAFAWNRLTAVGANLNLAVPRRSVAAEGNQWEHCGTGAVWDVTAVGEDDVRLTDGATVELGSPPGPRAGAPVLLGVSPPRPRTCARRTIRPFR